MEYINRDNPVYISYSWSNDANPDIEDDVKALCALMEENGIFYKLDKAQDEEHSLIGYGDVIQNAEFEIAKGNAIIVIFSPKYFKSPHCLHELHCILNNPHFERRVYPIWLPTLDKEVSLYDMKLAIDHVKIDLELRKRKGKVMGTVENFFLENCSNGQFMRDFERLGVYIKDYNIPDHCMVTSGNYSAVIKKLKRHFEMVASGEIQETISTGDRQKPTPPPSSSVSAPPPPVQPTPSRQPAQAYQPVQPEPPQQPINEEQPQQPVQVSQPEAPVQVSQPEAPVQVSQPEAPVPVSQPEAPEQTSPYKVYSKQKTIKIAVTALLVALVVIVGGFSIYNDYVEYCNRGASNSGYSDSKVGVPEPGIKSITETVDGVSFNMIQVEHGSFKMGAESDPDAKPEALADIQPVRDVTISRDFYIGECEVTVELWYKVMGSLPGKSSRVVDMPVSGITWDEAQDFVAKLSAKTGKRYRLPTEAEWEYAARGGKYSRGYIFSGSNDMNDVVSSDTMLVYVHSFACNELGIYNMSGNVMEWCADYYQENFYSVMPDKDPVCNTQSKFRVMRGGGRNSFISLKVYIRIKSGEGNDDDDNGLRLVLEQ